MEVYVFSYQDEFPIQQMSLKVFVGYILQIPVSAIGRIDVQGIVAVLLRYLHLMTMRIAERYLRRLDYQFLIFLIVTLALRPLLRANGVLDGNNSQRRTMLNIDCQPEYSAFLIAAFPIVRHRNYNEYKLHAVMLFVM